MGGLWGVKWSAGETDLVTANLDMPILELAAMFPDRTVETVKQKIKSIRRKIRMGFVSTVVVWNDVNTARLLELHAQGLSDEKISEQLGMTKKAVAAKRGRLKLFMVKAEERQRPDDFADVAGSLTGRELCKRYNCRYELIVKWRAEVGVTHKERVRKTPTPKVRSPKRGYVYFGGPKPAHTNPVDGSLAYSAARHLMRDYKPVCRVSTVNSKADKDLWIVGRATLTTADMIAKAAAKGFDVGMAA